MTNVLVIAAHPDDEVLGCGGTIAGHVENGDSVSVLILGEGVTSRVEVQGSSCIDERLKELRSAAHLANQILGVSRVELFNYPDNKLDTIPQLELIQTIEEKITYYLPETVYTHHIGDLNRDHRSVHNAVVTACRPTPNQSVRRLLSFEIASSTDWQTAGSSIAFEPNWFVDISSQLEKKTEALEAYSCEMRSWPHARSIESLNHLARWRGATVGFSAAEAFMLLRALN